MLLKQWTITLGRESNFRGDDLPMTWSERKLENIREDLVEQFGGYTETWGTGGWRDDMGDVIREDVAILTVAVDRHTFDTLYMCDLAKRIAIDLQQHSVMLSDGVNAEMIESGLEDITE